MEDKWKKSCTSDDTRKPASAPSLSARVSEANGICHSIQDFRLPANRHNFFISTPQKYWNLLEMLHTIMNSIRIYRNTLFSGITGITQTGKLNIISIILQFYKNLASLKQHCNFRILNNVIHTCFTTEIRVKFDKWPKAFAHWVFLDQAIRCD